MFPPMASVVAFLALLTVALGQDERTCTEAEATLPSSRQPALLQARRSASLKDGSAGLTEGDEQSGTRTKESSIAGAHAVSNASEEGTAKNHCDLDSVTKVTADWADENSWAIWDDATGRIVCRYDGGYSDGRVVEHSCCLRAGVKYGLLCRDSAKDGWHGGYLEIAGKQYCGEDQSFESRKISFTVPAAQAPPAPAPPTSCTDQTVTKFIDKYPAENSWQISLGDEVVCSGNSYKKSGEHKKTCCLQGGVQYTLSCMDSYGDGWNGGYIEVGSTQYCRNSNPQKWEKEDHYFTLPMPALNCYRRVRTELRLWSQDKWNSFERAWQLLLEDGDYYDDLVQLHYDSRDHAHGSMAFIPWHRKLLYEVETRLQMLANDCSITLPYWNSNVQAGNWWESDVLNNNRYGSLRSRTKISRRDPLYAWSTIVEFMEDESSRDIPSAMATIEQVHNLLHSYVGGDMATHYSPRDPLFFLHHNHIDHLAAWWQDYHVRHSGLQLDEVNRAFQHLPPLQPWSKSTGSEVLAADWFGEFDSAEGCVKVPAGSPVACISFGPTPTDPSLISETMALGDGLPARCQGVLQNLSMGKCTAKAISRSIPMTCHIDTNAAKKACHLFIHNVSGRPGVAKHVQECEKSAESIRAAMDTEGFQEPADEAEAALCFSCATVRCDDASMPGETW